MRTALNVDEVCLPPRVGGAVNGETDDSSEKGDMRSLPAAAASCTGPQPPCLACPRAHLQTVILQVPRDWMLARASKFYSRAPLAKVSRRS